MEMAFAIQSSIIVNLIVLIIAEIWAKIGTVIIVQAREIFYIILQDGNAGIQLLSDFLKSLKKLN